MHFDDRLATALRTRADGEGMRRIQLRQLLDLLGTSPAEARGDLIDTAFVTLGDLINAIPANHCAAILAETGLRLRSPRLVAALARNAGVIGKAAVLRAELSAEQWLDLIPALPAASRAYLRDRADLPPTITPLLDRLGVHDRALPPATDAAVDANAPAVAPPPQAWQADPDPYPGPYHGISALVRRIEAYRQARAGSDHRSTAESPRLPLPETASPTPPTPIATFDFATDPEGQIVWSDAAIMPMVNGLRLAAIDGSSGLTPSPALTDALRQRQPLHDEPVSITGAPAITGAWIVTAIPWFDSLTGRHMGWRGRMRRPIAPETALTAHPAAQAVEADRIRQLLHELRTPINAIQGFAEVIQQQLFGPTPHAYRALAANIVGDAAQMLAAFDELERLARLETSALTLESGATDAAAVFALTMAQLEPHLHPRGNGFALETADEALFVPLAKIELERIAWRLLATLGGSCTGDEVLTARLRRSANHARLDIALPAALAALDDTGLFSASAETVHQTIAAGVFGAGFALRLTRAETAAAGGRLTRTGAMMSLELPLCVDAMPAPAALQSA
ncbi:MAG: hypothetical protein RLZZ427_260 [Pseudomonadota bacterium]